LRDFLSYARVAAHVQRKAVNSALPPPVKNEERLFVSRLQQTEQIAITEIRKGHL